MNDTISRKVVLKFLKDMEAVVPDDDLISRSVKAPIECARRFITSMPSADAVPVVRCGECQNWETDWEPSPFNPDNPQHYCAVNDLFPNGDWFCKDGKRREDGDEDG